MENEKLMSKVILTLEIIPTLKDTFNFMYAKSHDPFQA